MVYCGLVSSTNRGAIVLIISFVVSFVRSKHIVIFLDIFMTSSDITSIGSPCLSSISRINMMWKGVLAKFFNSSIWVFSFLLFLCHLFIPLIP